MVRVSVRMMGSLREASGRGEEELTLSNGSDVSSVIRKLIEEHGESLEKALMDPIINSPRPNALILLNGVEVGNLDGLKTPVVDGDALVLLSVTHGG